MRMIMTEKKRRSRPSSPSSLPRSSRKGAVWRLLSPSPLAACGAARGFPWRKENLPDVIATTAASVSSWKRTPAGPGSARELFEEAQALRRRRGGGGAGGRLPAAGGRRVGVSVGGGHTWPSLMFHFCGASASALHILVAQRVLHFRHGHGLGP